MNLSSLNKLRNQGFTLLEVLIAMAILVFISFAIYQATTETYRLRDALSTEGNFYNGIRLATSIIQRDISLIYSPTLMLPDKPAQTQLQPGAPPTANTNPGYVEPLPDDLSQSFTFWSAAVDTTGLRPSRFIGTENKLSFVSVSHYRIYKDSPESNFAKITYELKKDEKNTENPGTMVLVKTESPNAFIRDDARDSFLKSYEILHGIKSLSYTYYQKDGNTWKKTNSWDSDRAETKNLFPEIIELKLEVLGYKKQLFEGKFKFRPEIPFNGLNPKI